jgi:nitrite reductase/ring-hydroxylating ferredoxin subunit
MREEVPVCRSEDLLVGRAVQYRARVGGSDRPCFVLRLAAGDLAAFVNVCAHRNQPVVTDASPTDAQGRVECRAHGALYDPVTGECVGGPCEGARLTRAEVIEHDGVIAAVDDDVVDDSVYLADGS